MIAIIQKGYNIYGTGSDIAAAVADANEWLSSPLDPESFYLLPSLSEADDGEICWAHCSKRLADAVKENGSTLYDTDGDEVDISVDIVSVHECDEFTEIKPLHNAATNTIELIGYQVDIRVRTCGREFLVVFQSAERRDGMKAYNGYEMDHGLCDADQYNELADLLGNDSMLLRELKAIATRRSRRELRYRQ
mgnify:CR=1 FL=1